MTDADRIAELEHENFRLRAQLGRAGVVVLPGIALPDDAGIDRLLEMTQAAWPMLRPKPEFVAEHRGAFLRGLEYLAYCRRDKLDADHALIWHYDACNYWLDAQAIRGRTSTAALYSAAITSGILYSSPVRFPWDCELGVGAGTTARPIGGWVDVLRAGRVPPAIELTRPLVRQVHELNLLPERRW